MRRSHDFTSIGLPSFNFVEPRKPPTGKSGRPRQPTHSVPTSSSSSRQLPAIGPNGNAFHQNVGECRAEIGIDLDLILDTVLRERAQQMEDTSIPEDFKLARLWQSLERFSDAGRFSRDGAASFNPITAALCIQAIAQVVRSASAIFPATTSSPATSVLLGALGNSVYFQFDPDIPFEKQVSFAHVVVQQQERIAKLEQQVAAQARELEASKVQVDDKLRSVTELFERIIPSERQKAITETISPFLDPELLTVLWNATATTVAIQKIEREPVVTRQRAVVSPWEQARKRAARLAASVLQERVKIIISLWGTMSREERSQLYKALDPTSYAELNSESTPSSLKSVLRSLEEVYAAEQIHRRRQLSIGRLGIQAKLNTEHGNLEINSRQGSPATSDMPLRRSTVRFGSRPYDRTNMQNNGEASTITIPNVLLGAFAPGKGDDDSNENTESNDQAGEALEPILRVCEDAFDLLCEDAFDNKRKEGNSLIDSIPPSVSDGYVIQAKRLLYNLLAAMRTSSDDITVKFQRSEAARLEALQEAENLLLDAQHGSKDEGFTSLVQTIIQGQRQNPSLLVAAINRSPDILTSAIAQNQGILFFAVTKFSGAVKRFLRLDPKACDHLDSLTHKHKGIQLLWNGNTTPTGGTNGSAGSAMWHDQYRSSDSTTAGSTVHLLEWFEAHVNDFASLFLENPDILKHLFVEMHDREDVTSFYRLMVLLQSTKGVHSFMTRASITALERVAQEDQSAITHLLRSIFCDENAANGKESESSRRSLGDKSPSSEGVTTIASPSAGNRDLLDQLRTSPYLVTCLSEFQPGALQDVFASHVDLWASYFVDIAASNDSILRQSLATRAESVEGGDMLVKLFDAITSGSTAMLNLQLLDCAVTGSDAARASEREASMRRKQHQCLYLRGHTSLFGAVIGPQIVFASYNPHSSKTADPATSKVASGKIEAVTKENGKAIRTITSKGGRGRRVNNASNNVSLSASTKKRAAQPSTATIQPLAHSDEVCGSSHSVAPCSSTESLTQAGSNRDKEDSFASSHRRLSGECTFQGAASIPHPWKLFLRIYHQQRQHQQNQSQTSSEANISEFEQTVSMSRAQVRTLVLDIWIELLKVDHLQFENASLAALAPFVCDYFITRYDSLSAVGFWLDSLIEALCTYHDDPRVRFFAIICGIFSSSSFSTAEGAVEVISDSRLAYEQPGYDNVLYYLHVLAHLFYDHMKIYKNGNYLIETSDGSCPISVETAQLTATNIFGFTLTRATIEVIQREIGALPRVQPPVVDASANIGGKPPTFVGPNCGFVELDDVMGIFMQQWIKRQGLIDERYKQEFVAHDTGVGRIGLEEFTKIVTTVTCGRVSARECRLVYADVGQEFLDRDALVRVTRTYQLRLFDTQLPEVSLLEHDLLELRQLLGRTNITSTQRELEDLVRYWNGMRRELAAQLESLHQKKATKALLKKQSMLVERLILGVQHQVAALNQQQGGSANPVPSSELRPQLDRAWHEARACVKQLHSAKLTNHYLSGLYIQSSMLKWIRQAQRKTQEDERTRTLEALSC